MLSCGTAGRRNSFAHHQLRAVTSGSRPGLVEELPAFTFQEYAQEVLLCAAHGTAPEQRKAAITKLAGCRDLTGESLVNARGDHQAPLRGLCCASARASPGARDFDAMAFALDGDGLPTGEMYVVARGKPSVTAFEARTSKTAAKQYRASCTVILNGMHAWKSLRGRLLVEHFLVKQFGEAGVHWKPTAAPAAPAASAAHAAAAGSAAGSSRRRRRREPGDGGAA
ncbi:hypothetical protein COO60DRAFT_1642268 [Scenedesmus sp. NREL 46B-D3]|nr:hypothetical protein COO60DRAFT_1642268 [Scenedesmus sp. NREL 46B-D3]